MQPDTIVPNPNDPQNFNRYSYVQNNPLKYIDPSGHVECSLLGNSDDVSACSEQKRYLEWGRTPHFYNLPADPDDLNEHAYQPFGPTNFAQSNWRANYAALRGMHNGLDFGMPTGTEVLAMDYGVVVCAGCVANYGAAPDNILVRHGDYVALYGHMIRIDVVDGDLVSPGTVVGLSGSSSNGYQHLHLEVRLLPPRLRGEGTGVFPANANARPSLTEFRNPYLFFEPGVLDGLEWQGYPAINLNTWLIVGYTNTGGIYWNGDHTRFYTMNSPKRRDSYGYE